jgi:hypothetical protein
MGTSTMVGLCQVIMQILRWAKWWERREFGILILHKHLCTMTNYFSNDIACGIICLNAWSLVESVITHNSFFCVKMWCLQLDGLVVTPKMYNNKLHDGLWPFCWCFWWLLSPWKNHSHVVIEKFWVFDLWAFCK